MMIALTMLIENLKTMTEAFKKTLEVFEKIKIEADSTKMCLTCKHSYIRKGGYDGLCHRQKPTDIESYISLRNIDAFDVCSHWEKK